MTATIAQIREAMAFLAGIIETSPSGEKYWPIFERMERELAVRDDREARLKAALAYETPADSKKQPAKRLPVRRTKNPLYADIFASWKKRD